MNHILRIIKHCLSLELLGLPWEETTVNALENASVTEDEESMTSKSKLRPWWLFSLILRYNFRKLGSRWCNSEPTMLQTGYEELCKKRSTESGHGLGKNSFILHQDNTPHSEALSGREMHCNAWTSSLHTRPSFVWLFFSSFL